ncbi:rod shape-determining protein MreD [Altererythrobacter sp. CAU 1778]
MDRLNPRARRDRYGTKINRDHSRILIYGVPWVTILLMSLAPMLPVIASSPILPPLGYLSFLAWRLVRPGLLPLWAGIPLGFWDDLFSGQPLGGGIMLWSLTLLAIEIVEERFPWRSFLQDWLTAALLIVIYIVSSTLFAGILPGLHFLYLMGPVLILSLLAYPIIARLVAGLDSVRLLRMRVL